MDLGWFKLNYGSNFMAEDWNERVALLRVVVLFEGHIIGNKSSNSSQK
jgi:hypothetical protein